MVVVNALVYWSEEDKKYIAHCYELDLIGEGDNEEQAKKELLGNIEAQIETAKTEGANLLFPNTKECKKKLEKIILADKQIKPEIVKDKIKNLEVHFYNEIKEENENTN